MSEGYKASLCVKLANDGDDINFVELTYCPLHELLKPPYNSVDSDTMRDFFKRPHRYSIGVKIGSWFMVYGREEHRRRRTAGVCGIDSLHDSRKCFFFITHVTWPHFAFVP